MSVGGTFDADAITRDRWVEFARSARLDTEWLLERVNAIRHDAAGAFATALDEIDDVDGHAAALRARLLPALEARAT